MKRPKKPAVDLDALAGELSDALAFIECAVPAMNAEDRQTGPELLMLERGVEALRKVHRDLDRAIQ